MAEVSAIQRVLPEPQFSSAIGISEGQCEQSWLTHQRQQYYHPLEAQKLIPDLEVCWGSIPTRQPDGDHRYERCECASKGIRFTDKARLEPSAEMHQTIIDIVSRHFNA